jgi:hypothetical protein
MMFLGILGFTHVMQQGRYAEPSTFNSVEAVYWLQFIKQLKRKFTHDKGMCNIKID